MFAVFVWSSWQILLSLFLLSLMSSCQCLFLQSGCPTHAASCSDDGTGTAKISKCEETYVANVDEVDTTKSNTMCLSK